MKIDLEQEKIDIIKKRIEADERFLGHENLFDSFLEEIIKRGFIIFKNMDMTQESAIVYLNKIVSSSIIYVLESGQRDNGSANDESCDNKDVNNEESSENIAKIPENNKDESENIDETTEAILAEKIFKNVKSFSDSNKYKNVKISYDFDYTPAIAAGKIKAKILQKFYDAIVLFNSQNPGKEYLQIYNLRYIQRLSVSKIAEKLNLSENEISKSLFELMEEVKKTLE